MTTTLAPRKILTDAAANSNHLSDDAGNPVAIGSAVDLSLFTHASVQLIWAGLTGVIDGTLQIEVSNNKIDWTNKSGALITVAGANGNESISLNGVVTERYYRARWTKNGVAGGTINCVLTAKGQ